MVKPLILYYLERDKKAREAVRQTQIAPVEAVSIHPEPEPESESEEELAPLNEPLNEGSSEEDEGSSVEEEEEEEQDDIESAMQSLSDTRQEAYINSLNILLI